MLYILDDAISKNDLVIMNEMCNRFHNEKTVNKIDLTKFNFYNRIFIEDKDLTDYYDNILNFLKSKMNKNKFDIIDKSKFNSWINKIIPETNKNDNFHFDMSFMTAVTYLNDNFKNGEFEYVDENDKIKKLNPKKGMTLIMDETLFHRVKPVKDGVRYSLITFFQFLPKENKTLL